jgi:hypothetical protein
MFISFLTGVDFSKSVHSDEWSNESPLIKIENGCAFNFKMEFRIKHEMEKKTSNFYDKTTTVLNDCWSRKWDKMIKSVTHSSVFSDRNVWTRGINPHTFSMPHISDLFPRTVWYNLHLWISLSRCLMKFDIRKYRGLGHQTTPMGPRAGLKKSLPWAVLRSISCRLSHKRAKLVNPLKTSSCDRQMDKARTFALKIC